MPPDSPRRSVSRKTPRAKTETVNPVPIPLASSSVSLVEVPLPEEESTKRGLEIKPDLPKPNDSELSVSVAAAPETVDSEPQDSQHSGKRSHTKMRNAASFILKAGIVAGSIAALEHGDKD